RDCPAAAHRHGERPGLLPRAPPGTCQEDERDTQGGGRTMSNTVVGDSLLDKVWREMDVATEAAMAAHEQGGDPMVVGKLLGQARGLAIAIYIMSIPHFDSPDSVASCAVTRWKNGTADGKAPSPVRVPPVDGNLSAGTDEDPIDVPAAEAPGAPLTPEQQ